MVEKTMSRTNTDASLTTARRRQLALYAWREEDQAPKTEQRPSYGFRNTGPTMDVPVSVYVGAQLVGQAATNTTSSTCGCSTSVTLQGDVKASPAK